MRTYRLRTSRIESQYKLGLPQKTEEIEITFALRIFLLRNINVPFQVMAEEFKISHSDSSYHLSENASITWEQCLKLAELVNLTWKDVDNDIERDGIIITYHKTQ